MWIDLNSAFAKIEQQSRPLLRNRPVAVTNRISRECCIITASYEARTLGVKTGMRRSEALSLCPNLILLESDPAKYYSVYKKLFAIMQDYSDICDMKSIDEGFIDLSNTAYDKDRDALINLALKIKRRVYHEIGDYITINIGLGTNRFLAKLAAGLHKPNGFDIIDSSNITDTYSGLELIDLTGISHHLAHRLILAGIRTPLELLQADEFTLNKKAFHSINGSYWYKRVRGYEVDDRPTKLSIVGRQWVVHQPTNDERYLMSCLHHLAESVGIKLRSKNKSARGISVWGRYDNGGRFQSKRLTDFPIYSDSDIWSQVKLIFQNRDSRLNFRIIGVYLYHIMPPNYNQSTLMDRLNRTKALAQAVDNINQRYGTTTLHSAESMLGAKIIKQKIPFGSTQYFDLL